MVVSLWSSPFVLYLLFVLRLSTSDFTFPFDEILFGVLITDICKTLKNFWSVEEVDIWHNTEIGFGTSRRDTDTNRIIECSCNRATTWVLCLALCTYWQVQASRRNGVVERLQPPIEVKGYEVKEVDIYPYEESGWSILTIQSIFSNSLYGPRLITVYVQTINVYTLIFHLI